MLRISHLGTGECLAAFGSRFYRVCCGGKIFQSRVVWAAHPPNFGGPPPKSGLLPTFARKLASHHRFSEDTIFNLGIPAGGRYLTLLRKIEFSYSRLCLWQTLRLGPQRWPLVVWKSLFEKVNLAYRATISCSWCSRFPWFLSLIDVYGVLWKLTKRLSFLTSLSSPTLGHTSFTRFPH